MSHSHIHPVKPKTPARRHPSTRAVGVLLLAFAVVAGLAAVSATSAYASDAIFGDNLVFDPFHDLFIRPDPNAYWYVLNWGDEDGAPAIWHDYFGDASSVTIESEGDLDFVRLALYPDSTPGFYTNAELAERDTGFASTEPGKWLPGPSGPVVLTARVRWSGNYRPDLTGNAIGTSGIWLWNSPITVLPDGRAAYGYTEAFGFNWAAEGALQPVEGFSATIVRGFPPIPRGVQALDGVDMNDWVDLKIVWSQVSPNLQSVDFFVNEELVLSRNMPPMGPLTVEIWNDNQRTSMSGSQYLNPVEDQVMDIDFIRVEQPE